MRIWNAVVYDPAERRLRLVWRLWGQLLLFLLMLFAEGVALGILSTALRGVGAPGTPAPGKLSALSEPLLIVWGPLATGAPMLASVWVATRVLDRRSLCDYGLRLDRRWWADLGFGLALGVLLMSLVFVVQWALGWIVVTGTLRPAVEGAFLPLMVAHLLGFALVGVYEEVFSRGYQLTNLAQGLRGQLGAKGALLAGAAISSLLFGVLHLGNPSMSTVSMLNLTLAGLLFALSYIFTGRLGVAVGLHTSWNFVQGNVFGFPVSGLEVNEVTLIATEPVGPELATGGAFGPEAGLVGLGAILLGMALTLLWVRWREGRLRLSEDIGMPHEA